MRVLKPWITVLGIVLAGCGDSPMPATPTPTAIDLSGTWSGTVTVLDAPATMTWTLTETGTAVTGPITLGPGNGTIVLNGFLTGAISGSTLTYTIAIVAGNIPSNPACTGQLGGTMTAAIGVTSTMNGTTAVNASSCSPPYAGGNLTLTRK
jgi:hypothetical protein